MQEIKNGWFKVPNWLFDVDHSLTIGEIAVYIYLCRCANLNGEGIYPSYSNIASACNCGRDTAVRHIKGLEDKGFIKIHIRYNSGEIKTYPKNKVILNNTNIYEIIAPEKIDSLKNNKPRDSKATIDSDTMIGKSYHNDSKIQPSMIGKSNHIDRKILLNNKKKVETYKKKQQEEPDEQKAAKAAVSLQNKDMEEIRSILKEFDIKIGRNAKAERLLQVLNESYYQNCKDKNYIQAIGKNLQEHSKAGNIKNPMGLLISAADNPALMKDIIQGNLYKNGEATAAKNRQIQEEAKRRENDKEACQQALENNMPQILKAYRKRNQYSGQMPEMDVPGFTTLGSLDDADADDDETIGDKLEKQRNTHGFN